MFNSQQANLLNLLEIQAVRIRQKKKFRSESKSYRSSCSFWFLSKTISPLFILLFLCVAGVCKWIWPKKKLSRSSTLAFYLYFEVLKNILYGEKYFKSPNDCSFSLFCNFSGLAAEGVWTNLLTGHWSF